MTASAPGSAGGRLVGTRFTEADQTPPARPPYRGCVAKNSPPPTRSAAAPVQAPGTPGVRASGVPAPTPMRVEDLRFHPLADCVPPMGEAERALLREDILARGIQAPLEATAEGVVLDGRHRLEMARELGLSRVPVYVVATDDEVAYMLRAALNRRHLTASQRAAIALELGDHEVACEQGRARQRANLRQFAEVATLPPRGERSREVAARQAQVSPRLVQDVATVRAADPELFEQVRAGKVPANVAAQRVRRARRYAEISAAPPLPSGPFDVILADPPWQLGSFQSAHAPENHYPTMPLGKIAALEVPAADDAIVYLWAVNMLLPEAVEVMGEWGFDYRSNMVWVKPSIGQGNWVRHRHEHVLIGVRGTFTVPEPADRPDSVIVAPRGRHSQKPADLYERIERAHPWARRCELFARGVPRAGWTAWGNEVIAA